MPQLCWELLFSMLCMLCTDKGSSFNLNPMISINYVVIMIMMMSIYVYMYVHMLLSNKVIRDHYFFMLMTIYVYVCMLLSDRVVRDHDCFMLILIFIYVCIDGCQFLIGSSRIILVEE